MIMIMTAIIIKDLAAFPDLFIYFCLLSAATQDFSYTFVVLVVVVVKHNNRL